MLFTKNDRILKLVATGRFNIKQGSFSYDPASIAANSTGEGTVTISGLKTTDIVLVEVPDLEDGLVFGGAWVSAANTLTIKLGNITAAAIDGAAKTWRYIAIRFGNWYD